MALWTRWHLSFIFYLTVYFFFTFVQIKIFGTFGTIKYCAYIHKMLNKKNHMATSINDYINFKIKKQIIPKIRNTFSFAFRFFDSSKTFNFQEILPSAVLLLSNLSLLCAWKKSRALHQNMNCGISYQLKNNNVFII